MPPPVSVAEETGLCLLSIPQVFLEDAVHAWLWVKWWV
jgi:hypothetical protein